jgi:hypothetical protein
MGSSRAVLIAGGVDIDPACAWVDAGIIAILVPAKENGIDTRIDFVEKDIVAAVEAILISDSVFVIVLCGKVFVIDDPIEVIIDSKKSGFAIHRQIAGGILIDPEP